VLVRPAAQGDCELVSVLFAAYFDEIALPEDLRDDRATVTAYLEPPSAVFLAFDRGVPVGIVAFRPLEPPPGGAETSACEAKRLYVRPGYRGRGVAEMLLDAFERHAHEQGFGEIYLDTRADMSAALALYVRRGYEPCARYNDNPVAAHFLRRRL
jgi:ribosomal protein S18 acetylase RimI-like enzyme